MTVNAATAEDLSAILNWLEQEYNESCGEGFRCNRNLIEKSLNDTQLFFVRHNHQAVAIKVGLYFDGIICVRKEFQKRGLERNS